MKKYLLPLIVILILIVIAIIYFVFLAPKNTTVPTNSGNSTAITNSNSSASIVVNKIRVCDKIRSINWGTSLTVTDDADKNACYFTLGDNGGDYSIIDLVSDSPNSEYETSKLMFSGNDAEDVTVNNATKAFWSIQGHLLNVLYGERIITINGSNNRKESMINIANSYLNN